MTSMSKSPESKKAVDKYITAETEAAQAQAEEEISRARKQAAQNGIGLHVNGNIVNCDYILSPAISINGDVVAGSTTPTDRENWTNRNRFVATGGNIHIDGNVQGQKSTQDMVKTRKFWHAERGDEAAFKLEKGETVEGKMQEELDDLCAVGNVRISGAVHGFSLSSQEGSITVGGKKSGFVITKKGGKPAEIESQPEEKQQQAPRRSVLGRVFEGLGGGGRRRD